MNNRSKATLELARELVDDVEFSRLGPESVILKASRLARLVGDADALKWLQFELDGYFIGAEYRVWMLKFGRFTDVEKGLGYWDPFAGIIAKIAANTAELQTLQIPSSNFAPHSSNPHESVTGWAGANVTAVTLTLNKVITRKANLTHELLQLASIRSKVIAAIHAFAVSHFHLLEFENVAGTIFETHRAAIDGVLASSAPDVLEKIPAISERLTAGDSEAISQAMNSVRRMIKSLADHLGPPQDNPIELDGTKYDVGSDKVLNRLQVFLRAHCRSESRRDRLNRSIRDIHSRASAGARPRDGWRGASVDARGLSHAW